MTFDLKTNVEHSDLYVVYGRDNILLPVKGTKSNNTFWWVWYLQIMFHYDSNF